MQEAQAPSGQVPQYLVVSEIQRRTDMRKRYQEQQQPQGTVADQIVQEAAGGIASMPPQGMPPQGMPPQGMPPQGMPPQGAPQQAMPPQAMPPQQMFSGGIIRLQEGGFLDQQTVSRAGDVRSQIERAIAEGASMSDLLAIFRNQPEAIELVKQLVADRQRASVSQYNPLSDEGAVNAYRSIPSMEDKESLPDQSPEGLASLGAMTGILPPEYDQQVSERRAGFADYFDSLLDQFAEGRAGDREFLNRRTSPVSAPRPKPANVQGESPIQTQAVSGQGGDPILANILNRQMVDTYMPDMPDRVLGDEPVKEDLAQEDAPDALKDAMDLLTDTAGLDFSNLERNPPPDFSDLIAESKKAGMANALMQLGAGIAGGDLSKGISAAGVAATKGQQAAKDMAIKQRLATYAAGREDAARDEQKRQFGLELGLKEDQYGKSLLQTSLSSIPNMIRQKELELANLRSTLPDDDPRITAIIEEIKSLTNQYNTFIARAEAEINDFKDYKVLGTTGA